MQFPVNLLRISRSLRFRLALSYLIFITLALAVIGGFFRVTLEAILLNGVDDALEEEWGAVKGYLTLERNGPQFFYDPFDTEESFIVSRLQRVFLLTDPSGKPLITSDIYESMGLDSPREIREILKNGKPVWRIRYDHGERFRIRSGSWIEKRQVFYLSIGKSFAENDRVLAKFTRYYLIISPVVILAGALLGWFMAGRALNPLNWLSRTAQRTTTSNLTTRIPTRGSGDELDHLIETYNAMMGRLNQSFEQIRQFSTDVSHELRTPLTVIRGQLEVALFTASTKEQYREAIEDALIDVERLSSIVRALLLLSQSETGQLVLHKTDVDLAEMVRDVADQFQIPAEAQGVRLSADAPEHCIIHADRIQIERLLSNLLSNAVKYTPAGGDVHVLVEGGSQQTCLVVEDTGAGIAAEHLPHIYDRFYRVPSADPEKGLGLGLSFVAWIVKAHEGTIEVNSRLGAGTRFEVNLPCGQTAVSEQAGGLVDVRAE
jgi:heavy metal sensor kinase